FFTGKPSLALLGRQFYLLRNSPPPVVLEYFAQSPSIPVKKLSHRLRTQLRKIQSNHGVDWNQLCIAHSAVAQFVFELSEETVRLRLLARSERDQSCWHWTGQEWRQDPVGAMASAVLAPPDGKTAKAATPTQPELPPILEDAR